MSLTERMNFHFFFIRCLKCAWYGTRVPKMTLRVSFSTGSHLRSRWDTLAYYWEGGRYSRKCQNISATRVEGQKAEGLVGGSAFCQEIYALYTCIFLVGNSTLWWHMGITVAMHFSCAFPAGNSTQPWSNLCLHLCLPSIELHSTGTRHFTLVFSWQGTPLLSQTSLKMWCHQTTHVFALSDNDTKDKEHICSVQQWRQKVSICVPVLHWSRS